MSNLNQFMGSGGTHEAIEFFPISGTFTAKKTGVHRVCVLGGGGSGGAASGATNARATGGGGGSFAWSEIFLTQGDTVPVTIGAGGAAVAQAATGAAAGNTGGNTTFGTYMTAYGG